MTNEELSQLLWDCAYKLQRYRVAHSGEYVGGVEYTELQRRIAAARESVRDRPA